MNIKTENCKLTIKNQTTGEKLVLAFKGIIEVRAAEASSNQSIVAIKGQVAPLTAQPHDHSLN